MGDGGRSWPGAATVVLALLAGAVVSTGFGFDERRQAERAKNNEAAARSAQTLADERAAEAQAREREAKQAGDRAEQKREEAERLSYLYCVAKAQQYWRADDPEQTNRWPAAAPAHRRGWEWGYLDRLRRPELLGAAGKWTVPTGLTVRADGKRLAAFSNSGDAGVWVWDLTTNQVVARVELGTTAARSPRGR